MLQFFHVTKLTHHKVTDVLDLFLLLPILQPNRRSKSSPHEVQLPLSIIPLSLIGVPSHRFACYTPPMTYLLLSNTSKTELTANKPWPGRWFQLGSRPARIYFGFQWHIRKAGADDGNGAGAEGRHSMLFTHPCPPLRPFYAGSPTRGGGRLAADLLLPSPALPLWELRFICLFITYHIPIALHGTPTYQYMASDIKNVSRSSPLPILERPG
jgi:hypothetical protein